MISSTLGAPFGGTMLGGHQGLELVAFSLITPPNFGGGGGSCFPLIVVVALGEPGTPVTCWACAVAAAADNPTQNETSLRKRQPIVRFPGLSSVRIVIPFEYVNFGRWKSGLAPPFHAIRADRLDLRRQALRALAR